MSRPKKKAASQPVEEKENVMEEISKESELVMTDEVVMNDMQREIHESLALQHALNDRRAAYPTLLEQIEALWLAQKGDLSEFKRIDDIINEVKTRYPKPEVTETNKEEGEI